MLRIAPQLADYFVIFKEASHNFLVMTTPMVFAIPLPLPVLYQLSNRARRFSPLRGRFVALGQRGIVEHGIDEIIHGAPEDHDRLADVQQFGCAFADDVDAQNMPRLAMKDDFEPAGSIAANLSAGDLAIIATPTS